MIVPTDFWFSGQCCKENESEIQSVFSCELSDASRLLNNLPIHFFFYSDTSHFQVCSSERMHEYFYNYINI